MGNAGDDTNDDEIIDSKSSKYGGMEMKRSRDDSVDDTSFRKRMYMESSQPSDWNQITCSREKISQLEHLSLVRIYIRHSVLIPSLILDNVSKFCFYF